MTKFFKPILILLCISIIILGVYFFNRSMNLFETINYEDIETIDFYTRKNTVKITNPSTINTIINWIQNSNQIKKIRKNQDQKSLLQSYGRTPFLIFNSDDSKFTINMNFVMSDTFSTLFIIHDNSNVDNYYTIESVKLNYFMFHLNELLKEGIKVSETKIVDIIKEVEAIDF